MITPLNSQNSGSSDSEKRSYLNKGHFFFIILRKLLYFSYFEPAERKGIMRNVTLVKANMRSLLYRVFYIIRICSEEKMFRVNTSFVIPSRTVVANEHPLWNRPAMENPRRSVCKYLLRNIVLLYYPSISGGFHPLPQPARFSFIKLFIKSFNEVGRQSLRSKILRCNFEAHSIIRLTLVNVVTRLRLLIQREGTFILSPWDQPSTPVLS